MIVLIVCIIYDLNYSPLDPTALLVSISCNRRGLSGVRGDSLAGS